MYRSRTLKRRSLSTEGSSASASSSAARGSPTPASPGPGKPSSAPTRKTAGQSRHTLASFVVDDACSVVDALKAKGVTFEKYDMPGMKTKDGVAPIGDTRAAWLKDPDGNILEIVGG
jgi:hypothetical protein